MTAADRDIVVERVVRRIPVPDQAPDFWDRLGRRLRMGNASRSRSSRMVVSGSSDGAPLRARASRK
jgi:hypothetical protein